MSTEMTIQVGFKVGSNLRDKIKMAKEKAKEWGVSAIHFYHNSTHFSVGKYASVEKAMERFDAITDKSPNSKTNYVVVS